MNGYASDTAATANTIVRRDANKYVYATYYNSSISNEDINSYTNDPAVMFTSNDKWIRRTTKANLQTWLGLGSAAYTASTAYLASTTKYAASSSVGGAATSLANFENNNSTAKNANDVTYNAHTYYTSNGPTQALGASTNDAALYCQAYSTSWVSQIAQDYRNGNLYTRGKNNGTWQRWRKVRYSDDSFEHSDTVYLDSTTNKVTVSKSTSAWDAQLYSKDGYADNVFVTFKPNQTNMALMVGLDANPSQDANYANIDYCWYVHNDAKLTMFESGTERSSVSGHTTYVAGDELRVEYSGGYIRYYHNGVVCREVSRAISGKLYMDSSFHGASSCIYDVSYGPCARNAQYADSARYATSAGSATDSTKLPLAGGTMTGVITSSYKSSTWVNSLTSSVVTLSDAASSFGGWICGPSKNGRLVISSYQSNDDKLYFGYGERGRTDNSYAKSMTWEGTTGTLTTDKFVGALQGNADTATTASKLSNTAKVGDTNKPVYFTANGVPAAISYTIDKSVPSNADFTNTWRPIGTGATDAAAGNHTHGNIQSGGTLQTNDITIANGDKIVVTDSSDSAKVARTSISFDGSTATKCLTQKGTWESFTNNVGTITGSGTSGYIAKWNGGSSITNGPAFGTATTTYLRNDGSWTTPANATFTIGETADPDVTARKIKLTASGSGGSDSSIAVSYAANTSHLKHPNSATNTTWGTENLPIYLAADGAPLQCGFHVFTGTVAANSQVDLNLKFGLVIFGRISTSATPSMAFIDQWGGKKDYYSNTTHVISVVTNATTVRVKNNGSTIANYIAIGSTAS